MPRPPYSLDNSCVLLLYVFFREMIFNVYCPRPMHTNLRYLYLGVEFFSLFSSSEVREFVIPLLLVGGFSNSSFYSLEILYSFFRGQRVFDTSSLFVRLKDLNFFLDIPSFFIRLKDSIFFFDIPYSYPPICQSSTLTDNLIHVRQALIVCHCYAKVLDRERTHSWFFSSKVFQEAEVLGENSPSSWENVGNICSASLGEVRRRLLSLGFVGVVKGFVTGEYEFGLNSFMSYCYRLMGRLVNKYRIRIIKILSVKRIRITLNEYG